MKRVTVYAAKSSGLDTLTLPILGHVFRRIIHSEHSSAKTFHRMKLMRQCPYIIDGLRRAGFTGGWLETNELD